MKSFITRENIQFQNLMHFAFFLKIMGNRRQILTIDLQDSVRGGRNEQSFHIQMSKSFGNRCN